MRPDGQISSIEIEYRNKYWFVLFYVCFFPYRSEFSLGDVSTSSLKGTVMVAQCDCSEHDKCECCVPSLRLNYTYIMWLKMMIGETPLWSPLMSVKPIAIGKPDQYLKPFLMENESRMSSGEGGHKQNRKRLPGAVSLAQGGAVHVS